MTQLPPIERRTVPAAFARALAEAPDKHAFADHLGVSWTYRETVEGALRTAAGLARLGVGPGEGVAMVLDNSLDLLRVAFAVGLTGRVQVPVNTAYKGDFLSHVLTDSGAGLVVAEAAYVDRLAHVADAVPLLRHLVVRGGPAPQAALDRLRERGVEVTAFEDLHDDSPAEVVEVAPGDLMALMYTSGTTGRSKGVEISHAHAYTYASREDSALPGPEDRILVTLPMFHLAGQWYGAYQTVIHRASCVVLPTFSRSGFWDQVREHRITVTTALGAIAELLQQAPPRDDDADNPLRLAVMAPLASDVEGFRRRFDVGVGAVYGMSEVGCVMGSEPDEVVPGEAGLGRDGYALRLVDPSGEDVATGEVGELLVRAEHPETTMLGYHGLPERTAETLAGGWVHTGDMFRRDEGGHYYFTDRAKDALRRRGENVSSFEVERVVNQHPDVAESAVVGVPSTLAEDEIKAVVVVREDRTLDLAGLIGFLVERLPYFMVPRYVEVVDDLPRTPTQKIQKHLLRESGLAPGVWDREAAGIVVGKSS